MIIVYIAAACLVAYGFLFGFRQLQSLQERITRLESDKQEMETLILTFMESMNDIVANDDQHETGNSSPKPVTEPVRERPLQVQAREEVKGSSVQVETSRTEASDQIDVEDVLLRHSVRDAARILGKGEGEMALYAKLRKK